MTGRLGNGDLNLPFEPSPPGQTMPVDDAIVAGGLVTLACVVPVDGLGNFPAILFRFTRPDGTFLPPVMLVLDDEDAQQFPKLVADAVAAARKAAA